MNIKKTPRPAKTEKLLWLNGDEILGADAFRFHVFYGQVDRWFRVGPLPEFDRQKT